MSTEAEVINLARNHRPGRREKRPIALALAALRDRLILSGNRRRSAGFRRKGPGEYQGTLPRKNRVQKSLELREKAGLTQGIGTSWRMQPDGSVWIHNGNPDTEELNMAAGERTLIPR